MNGLTVGGLFDGAGLLAYGLHLAGFEHRWLCEADPWRRSILQRRFPGVPVFDDVRAVGAAADRVDVIAGGFPCKGASTAGKRTGFDHPETVLWREMARAIRELRPRYVVVENVAAILSVHHGAVWGEVLGDLAACDYDVEWDVLPAAAVGAPHRRERVFAVAAYADGVAGSQAVGGGGGPAPNRGPEPLERAERRGDDAADAASAVEWGGYEPAIRRWEAVHGPAPEPLVRRLDDGNPAVRRLRARVDRSRLSALGDGVQVQVAQIVGAYILEREADRMRNAA